MAFLVAAFIWLVGVTVASIAAASGFYADVPIKIATGTTIVAVLIALTHGQVPNW
jgi:uncharacterized protein with PQ loop repeat